MACAKRIKHPRGIDIQFDSKWHQYKVGNTALRSVSKLLDHYFPFDEVRVLSLMAKKTGEPAELIKKRWSRQALLGKNIHEYIECRLLDSPPPTFTLLLKNKQKRLQQRPSDSTGPTVLSAASDIEEDMLHGEEELYMPVADAAVQTIKNNYDIIAVEQVVASPEWGLAGTIDLVGRNKKTNKILIGDWKTSGTSISNFRFGSFETPCPGCLRHLPNSKFYRYAMQVIVYGEMLKKEKYFELGYFDSNLSKVLPTDGREGATGTVVVPSSPSIGTHSLEAYHQNMQHHLEYGIVQMAKGDDGQVLAEFKEVTERTVLPADVPECSFLTLLRSVMNGT